MKVTIKMLERQINIYNDNNTIYPPNPAYNGLRLQLDQLAGYYKLNISCSRNLEHKTLVSGSKKECYSVIKALNTMSDLAVNDAKLGTEVWNIRSQILASDVLNENENYTDLEKLK